MRSYGCDYKTARLLYWGYYCALSRAARRAPEFVLAWTHRTHRSGAGRRSQAASARPRIGRLELELAGRRASGGAGHPCPDPAARRALGARVRPLEGGAGAGRRRRVAAGSSGRRRRRPVDAAVARRARRSRRDRERGASTGDGRRRAPGPLDRSGERRLAQAAVRAVADVEADQLVAAAADRAGSRGPQQRRVRGRQRQGRVTGSISSPVSRST